MERFGIQAVKRIKKETRMENSVLVQFKDLGVILVLALYAIGSVLGDGIAGINIDKNILASFGWVGGLKPNL